MGVLARGHYCARVSTSVVLTVTPKDAIDPDRYVGDVPADIAAALTAAGQPVKAALSRRGSEPCRLQFQLSGPRRVEDGQRLEAQLRHLGYESDVSFSPS